MVPDQSEAEERVLAEVQVEEWVKVLVEWAAPALAPDPAAIASARTAGRKWLTLPECPAIP